MEASGTASGQDGSLPVADTAAIIPIINQVRIEKSCLFDVVVRSQDYHTVNHISFGPMHGLEPFPISLVSGSFPSPVSISHLGRPMTPQIVRRFTMTVTIAPPSSVQI
jgi:hypothetical protein